MRRAAASSTAFTTRQSGDAFDRWSVQAGGTMEWSSGAVAASDVTLSRQAAGILQIDHNSQPQHLFMDVIANAVGYNATIRMRSNPDSQGRLVLSTNVGASGKAGLDVGSGTAAYDTNLYRYQANVWASDDQFSAGGGLTTKTKAGVPSDADITLATDGTILLDTTNNRIYVRSNGLWKYAALT